MNNTSTNENIGYHFEQTSIDFSSNPSINDLQNTNEIVNNITSTNPKSQFTLNSIKKSNSDFILNNFNSSKKSSLSLSYSLISKISQKNNFHLKRLNSTRLEKKGFSQPLQETKKSRYISQNLANFHDFHTNQMHFLSKKINRNEIEIEIIDLTKEFELD